MRLGLPLPYSDDIHNSIVPVWSDCLSELKLHHKKEPRDRYSTSDSRPDIIVFDTGAGSNVELDVALAHPWSSDIFPTSATTDTDGAAASRREERKKARYDREISRRVERKGDSSGTRTFWKMGKAGRRISRPAVKKIYR